MKILITELQLKRIVSEQNDAGFDRRYGTADAAAKTNTERQFKLISEQPESRFGPEQYMSHSERQDFYSGNSERAGAALMSGSKKQRDNLRDNLIFYKQNAHTINNVLSFGSLFIPVVGPFLSTAIAGFDLKLSYDEAKTEQERAMIAFGTVLMLMPGLKSGLNLTAPAIKNMSSAGLIQIGKKLITNKVNELTTIEKQVVSEVGANQKQISVAINNKPRFNLERGPKAPKKRWDYQKNSMGNDLEFVGKPKGSENVAEVRNVETPTESVTLKKRTSENGTEYYYFSANMPSSPIKAARAMNMLKSKIPSGARFGEPTTGSLSTDSFYSMLRRTKEGYTPKVENMITLNKQGSKRFQNDIKNNIQHDYSDIRFSTYQDAQVLSNALNKEISKAGINVPSKVVKDVDGYYNIKIPNIQYFKK